MGCSISARFFFDLIAHKDLAAFLYHVLDRTRYAVLHLNDRGISNWTLTTDLHMRDECTDHSAIQVPRSENDEVFYQAVTNFSGVT